jgi:hypothetical protein
MRERRQILLPTVLALTFVALLVTPIAAMAASGLPATITMNSESAGPGATVEVTGLDFPANTAVELQLTTADGAAPIGTATTADGGYFREVLTLPANAPAGTWQIEASAPDGSNATLAFTVAAAELVSSDAAAVVASEGNSLADIVVMIIIAGLIAAVGGGILYVWNQSKVGDAQPGMSTGADPIWSGQASKGQEPEATSTDEPVWKTARSDP